MACLIIMSGNMKGKRFEISQDETYIGRAPENTIVPTGPAVSSKHCCIIRDGKKYSVKDLNSTNGTRLNSKLVQESRLNPKDLIMVGDTEIMFGGEDVEVEESVRVPSGIFEVSTQEGGVSRAAPEGAPTAFGKKRDSKIIWIVVIIFVSLLALAALVFFVYKLFA